MRLQALLLRRLRMKQPVWLPLAAAALSPLSKLLASVLLLLPLQLPVAEAELLFHPKSPL